MHELLWEPSQEFIEQTNMNRFIKFVAAKHDLDIAGYDQLYQWSISNIPDFWADVWAFCELITSQPYDRVIDNYDSMLDAAWFPGARLNFAENLLRYRDDKTALIFCSETGRKTRMTYAELYDQTARLALSLKEFGIKAGDRVGGYMPNIPETIIAMLAATSLGAIWTSTSTDFGIRGVIDRFGQTEPRLLFCTDAYSYNGKEVDVLSKAATVMEEVASIEKLIVVPFINSHPDLNGIPKAELYSDFISPQQDLTIDFAQLPFDYPVYILYSSGTTGVPKCIVHGIGGTLLQHLKELYLHTDLKRDDTIFYFTTCSWMMWNWLVSSLAIGATLYLYDGSPFYPQSDNLFRLAAEDGITVFGTSAKYLETLEQRGASPGKSYDLSQLRAILSTGSPLSAQSFHYVYREIKNDLLLSSISGGTDIISCFGVGNPIGPVYAGELQCRGLGMDVRSYNSSGQSIINEKGELVCLSPFPSRPVCFWNDPGKEKYRKAYYSVYPGIWHHGDFIEITETGGLIIYGRSDATLNPGGVRIGTAEIYRQLEGFSEIADSLVCGQSVNADMRVILFVKMADNYQLDSELKDRIKAAIRQNTTPRHVPELIISVPDVPYTMNGKKVELAVRNIIENQPVLNRDALGNPEALEYFRDIPELKLP